MKSISHTALLASLCAGASPALADISAEELWAAWQENAEITGQEISAEVNTSGSGLTLTNVTVTQDLDDAQTVTSVDEITMTEAGGGVSIALSNPVRVASEVTDDGDQLAYFEVFLTAEALDINVTGDPDNITYTYAADAIRMSEGEVVVEDDEPEIGLDMVMEGVAAVYTVIDDGTEMTFSSTGNLAGMSLTLDAKPPAGESGAVNMRMALGAMDLEGSGSLSAIRAFQGTAVDGLPENFSLSSSGNYESLEFFAQGEGEGEQFQMSTTNEGGAVAFSLDENALIYDLSGRGSNVSLQSSDLPVPIDVNAESTRLAVQLPVTPSEDTGDMALTLDYNGLTMSDAIWGLFDPTGAFPRDPAVLRLVATGTARLFTPLIGADPATMIGPPGELRSVDLEDLEISAAGASLTGTGAVTFAPGQLIPQPVGSIDLALAGLNGLLDRLTQAGFLPPEQAGMARGVAGMFARPGATADTLETTIEFLPGGGITANGIPLQQ